MKEEYDALMKNETWELVKKPENAPIVDCKWVYRVKQDKDGNVTKLKSRLVARGFSQQYGVNYWESYSPVIKNSTLRLLLAIAVEEDYFIEQIDIKNAYVNSDLEELIYMRQPDGFVIGENMVCRLKKSLYGLKQSGYQWNKLLNEKLIKVLGFKRLKSDPCVYVKVRENEKIIIAVYVDDLLFFGKKRSELIKIKSKINKIFAIDDLGECKFVLGLSVKRGSDWLSLNQRQYILDMLQDYDMMACNVVTTPLVQGQKMAQCKGSSAELKCVECGIVDITTYRSLIGSLMFLAVSTRPDIAFAVSMLSRHNCNPHPEHFVAAKRVLRYLRGTLDDGIVFRKSNQPLTGYADADWANDPVDRRSYTGFVFMLANGPVAWEARKQQTVALSSTEAEYKAISQASREALFLTNILRGLSLEYLAKAPKTNFNVNLSDLAKHKGFNSRAKHIRHHFVRELVENGSIKMEHLGTDDMIADLRTKGLGKSSHDSLKKTLVNNCK